MDELRVSSDWTYRGLPMIVLENRLLRVLILPEAGARIWQITYKPQDTDLLWNNPRIAPARLPFHSCYDDVWSGGWDELFPNDEVATIDGETYPDHGELWTGQWQAETFSEPDEAGVRLRFLTPTSSVAVEKTVVLRPGASRVWFTHSFTNRAAVPFPFLWKLHPAFAVSPQHRIDFPPLQVELEPAFPGTLSGAPLRFAWPMARIGGREVDLSRIPSADKRQLYFFYGTQIEAGWCALTNTDTGLACGLYFDPAIFRSCWLFATYGGWRDYNVAVLEPCTGYPLNFEAMRKAGRHTVLPPGETLRTEVVFTVQTGLHSVASIAADGTMTEQPELASLER